MWVIAGDIYCTYNYNLEIFKKLFIYFKLRIRPLYVNLNNTAKGENNVFQNLKKSTRKDDVVLHFFLFISMSGLIDDSWILTSASVLSLLEYVVLVEGNKSSLTQLCG